MRLGWAAAAGATIVLTAASASAQSAPTRGIALAARQPDRKPLLDLRLRSLTVIAPATAITAIDGQLHRRLIGSMVDYHPSHRSGFFVAGGGQQATQALIAHDVNSSLARLLETPRVGGLRISGKVAPVATMGYVEGLGRRAEVRVEGGALLGRMAGMSTGFPDSRGPREPALVEGGTRTVNGVVRMSLAAKF